ncbi:hypothetical protein DL96DRAFT_1622200 [Flagelloscypha sp. PMI_526]|nr:hypothetical protein DL96DRAFT_1622200 [Flagelloscypha sp. PMI_526]
MPNLFTRLRELDLSCDPSPSAMPMDREQFHAAVQCSTQELRVLILDSQTLHALASHPYGLFTLQMLVQRQKQLKIFRVLPFYSQSRPPHPKIINNVLLPLSQSVECVEGSFWTLNSMLPAHVRPKKLRFIENADLFNQDLPVRESLLQRLQHVRVLSYRYKSGDEPRKYSVFIPIFADLPLLEVLGLEFDDAVQAEWLHWAISTFSLGCLNIKKLIIAVRLMTVRPRDLIGQSTFQDIESLDYIRLEMARGVCWQKKRGDPDWQRVSVAENDWWIYE